MILLLSGCGAGAGIHRNANPKELVSAACEPGAEVRKIQGSVWIKAQSKDASGQFPAMVVATYPDSLTLEVTNLLGATQAVIKVDGRKYLITHPDSAGKFQKESGSDSWGGIPLRWATDLFLGRIPCPAKAAQADARVSVSESDELSIETKPSLDREAEKFVYRFRDWGGKPWPESLHWERGGPVPVAVDFKFDDPEDITHSPRKWEAKSSLGEVKARWRERKTGA